MKDDVPTPSRSQFFVLLLPLALGTAAFAAPPNLHAQVRTDSTAGVSAAAGATSEGLASFYAKRRQGRRTASGERFDNNALVAAHPTLPFGTRLRVTNLANNRSVEVRVVDRGPSAARRREGYVIDLSRAAARTLGFVRAGRARVRLQVLGARY
jgi:rare lipoprotein A